jgi:hypothetical protein
MNGHQGQIAQQKVREAVAGEAHGLTRQPLQRAVLPDVDDRIGAPAATLAGLREPAIERQVGVRRREIGHVVDRRRVHAVAARRLDGDKGVAEVEACQAEDAAGGHVVAAWRRAPLARDLLAARLGEVGEPAAVALSAHARGSARELLRRQDLAVVAPAVDQRLHERIRCLRQRTDGVAHIAHRGEETQQ